MRTISTALLGLVILSVVYLLTFGLPSSLAMLNPFSESGADASAQNTNAARPSTRGGRAATVVTKPLELQPYTTTIQAIGNATSWNSVEVTAEATGRVIELLVAANTDVEAGDVLLRLDDRSEKLMLELAQAEMGQAKSLVDRYTRLRSSDNSSVTDVVMTEAELALTQARISVGLAGAELDKRTVKAPISGRLGLTTLGVGDLISESDFIVTIDDSSTLQVEFELPERSISMLSLGREVLVSTPTYAGRVFNAEITAFDSRLDNTTRSVSVQARIENSENLLWSGMTFAVRLLSSSEPLVSVPATALSWARHGAGVWIVEDGKATRHPVTVRFRQGGKVWVDTDAPEGAVVVTEGAVKLREGSTVASTTTQSDT